MSTLLDPDWDDQTVLNRVTDFYHEELQNAPQVLKYLNRLGLDDRECISHFKLGYSNRQLGLRLPKKNRKAGKAIRSQLERIGLYRESGHEHFRGSLIVPIINEHAKTQQCYAKKLLTNLRHGTEQELFLPQPKVAIFNPDSLFMDEVILCDSFIDALTFWRYGFRNVTVLYDTVELLPVLLEACKTHQVIKALFAFTSAYASNVADISQQFINQGINCYHINGLEQKTVNQLSLSKPNEVYEFLATRLKDATLISKSPSPQISEIINQLSVKQYDEDVMVTIDDRFYRIKGLFDNNASSKLKINVLISRGEHIYVDTLDIYNARQRTRFEHEAAEELLVQEASLKHDLGRLILEMETLKTSQKEEEDKGALLSSITITETERAVALDFLKSPNLFEQLLSDFKQCHIVGEETNLIMVYIACVSRILTEPLAIVIQSSSASGKTTLMDVVLSLMPEEVKIEYSAMTGQSLFYMEQTDIRHKILAISEDEGAKQASYALKLLQSEGCITIASTGKDNTSGKHKAYRHVVEGPVMLMFTTTSIDIDEELLNRCLVLSVDDSRQQTQAILQLQRQRRTLTGLTQQSARQQIIAKHHAVQRLLKPINVVNPYAEQLTFLDNQARLRRDHEKYLTLIDTITLLHQYQRPIQKTDEGVEYIEVTLEDIKQANQLAHTVLGKTLDDLPPQTRHVLQQLYQYVSDEATTRHLTKADVRFRQKQIRNHLCLGNAQTCTHLKRLVELEYLIKHKQGRGQSYQYELLYDGQGEAGEQFLMHLIDVDSLQETPVRNEFGVDSATIQSTSSLEKPLSNKQCEETTELNIDLDIKETLPITHRNDISTNERRI